MPSPWPTLLTTGQTSSKSSWTYQGNDQKYLVPAGVTKLHVKLWGAGGGGSYRLTALDSGGGAGGYTECTIDVTPGEVLNIIVGGGGSLYTMSDALYNTFLDGQDRLSQFISVAGGYGGGGNSTSWVYQGAYDTPPTSISTNYRRSAQRYGFFGSGGGRSAIQRTNSNGVLADLITAGGGGGGGGPTDEVVLDISHTPSTMYDCQTYGGAGGGSLGGISDNLGCQTTATGGSQSTAGTSSCGRGSLSIGGSSSNYYSSVITSGNNFYGKRGPGGGGGFYGGAPGCVKFVQTKTVTSRSGPGGQRFQYVTGGTGGSGFTGGCRSSDPAVSLTSNEKAAHGWLNTYGLPPMATDTAYVPGVGVGGQATQDWGNEVAKGGNGYIVIEALHTLPTSPQSFLRPMQSVC